jgi:hypothetical protein
MDSGTELVQRQGGSDVPGTELGVASDDPLTRLEAARQYVIGLRPGERA